MMTLNNCSLNGAVIFILFERKDFIFNFIELRDKYAALKAKLTNDKEKAHAEKCLGLKRKREARLLTRKDNKPKNVVTIDVVEAQVTMDRPRRKIDDENKCRKKNPNHPVLWTIVTTL